MSKSPSDEHANRVFKPKAKAGGVMGHDDSTEANLRAQNKLLFAARATGKKAPFGSALLRQEFAERSRIIAPPPRLVPLKKLPASTLLASSQLDDTQTFSDGTRSKMAQNNRVSSSLHEAESGVEEEAGSRRSSMIRGAKPKPVIAKFKSFRLGAAEAAATPSNSQSGSSFPGSVSSSSKATSPSSKTKFSLAHGKPISPLTSLLDFRNGGRRSSPAHEPIRFSVPPSIEPMAAAEESSRVPLLSSDSGSGILSDEEEENGEQETTDVGTVVADFEDEETDIVDLRVSGADRFIRGALLSNRREALAKTLQQATQDMVNCVERLNVKVTAELRELKKTISKQEIKLKRFKSAYISSTAMEINEIVMAGWSRSGHLGFIDVTAYLAPILRNQALYPIGMLKPKLLGYSAPKPDKKLSGKSDFPDNFLTPPEVPKLRPQYIALPSSIKTCCSAILGCSQGLKQDAEVDIKDGGLSMLRNSDSEALDDWAEDFGHDNADVAAVQQYDRRRRSTFGQLFQQLQLMDSEQSVDRQADIRTFLLIGSTGATVCPDLPPRNDVEMRFHAQTSAAESSTESALDAVDENEINATLGRIKSPRFLGRRLETFWVRWCKIKMESTEHYRKSVRETLIRYYKSEKSFRRRCIGILPGGLSTVQLTPPPRPSYPPGGLKTPQSSFSSKDVLSDILSDAVGEETTNSEDEISSHCSSRFSLTSEFSDGTPKFSHKNQSDYPATPLITGVSATLEARRAEQAFQTAFSRRFSSLQNPTRNTREIYTTSFDIGTSKLRPSVFVELSRSIDTLFAKDDNSSATPWRPSDPADTESVIYDSCLKRCCTPLECCVGVVNNLPQHEGSKSAHVTEIWQLADDPATRQGVWIYRGRTVKPT